MSVQGSISEKGHGFEPRMPTMAKFAHWYINNKFGNVMETLRVFSTRLFLVIQKIIDWFLSTILQSQDIELQGKLGTR